MIDKYQKPKTCLDMSGLTFGKINRKQRINLEPRKEKNRRKYCIIPGCRKPVGKGRHHILQKSIMIIDIEENMLDPCDFCHPLCDEGIISQADQLELKAHELGETIEELLQTLSKEAGALVYLDGEQLKIQKLIQGCNNV